MTSTTDTKVNMASSGMKATLCRSIKDATIMRLNLKELLEDSRELIIEHNDQDYILRITRQNKLILTK